MLDNSKKILLSVVTVVVLLAVCVGVGGGWLIFKNKKFLEEMDTQIKVKSSVSTKLNSKSVAAYAETKGGTDFQPYMKNLQDKVKSNWTPPKNDKESHIVTELIIAKDGSLKSLNVLTSQLEKDEKDAVVTAIESSAPFAPLPKSFKDETVKIQFTFDYNVKSSK